MGFFQRFRRRRFFRRRNKEVAASPRGKKSDGLFRKSPRSAGDMVHHGSTPGFSIFRRRPVVIESPVEVGEPLAPEDQFYLEIPYKLPQSTGGSSSRQKRGNGQKKNDQDTSSTVSTITWYSRDFRRPKQQSPQEEDGVAFCPCGPINEEAAPKSKEVQPTASASRTKQNKHQQQQQPFPSFFQWFFACSGPEEERSTAKTARTSSSAMTTMRSARPLLDFDDEDGSGNNEYNFNNSTMAVDDRSGEGSRRFSRMLKRPRSIPRMRSLRRGRSTSKRGERTFGGRQSPAAGMYATTKNIPSQ